MIGNTSVKTVTLRLFGIGAALLVILNVAALKLSALLPIGDSLQAAFDAEVVALELLSFLAWPAFPLMGIAIWLVPQLKERPQATGLRALACFLLMLSGIMVETTARTVLSGPIVGNGLALLGSLLQLVAAAVYLFGIWRDTSRSLHPSVRDTLIQLGALWLFGAVAVHFAQNLGMTLNDTGTLYVQISIGLYKAFALGFVANTGLWILISTMPHFLASSEPAVRPGSTIFAYNLLLLAWVLGEVWSLHFPYTWVRLPLALVGCGLAGATLRLLGNLRVFDYLGASPRDLRRISAQTAIGLSLVCLLVSSALIAVIGVWLGSTNQVSLPYIGHGLRELLQVGMGSYLVIGLCIAFLGPSCTAGLRLVLVWGAMIAAGLGLTVVVVASLVSPLTALDLNWMSALGSHTGAIGHFLAGLWLLACLPRN